MRLQSSLLILILTLPVTGFALAFSDVFNQTAIGPFLKSETKEYVYTPAFGISGRINGLEIGDRDAMFTTNRNSYLLGLDINGSNTTLNLPFKDPEKSRQSRVDSKLIYIASSLNINPHIKAEIAYDYNKGYTAEENEEKGLTGLNFPELSLERITASLYYLKNEEHSSFLFSPVMYKRSLIQDSSSWIYGVDLSQYNINNLNIDKLGMQQTSNKKLTDVQAYDLSIGASYSRSIFLENWFYGGAFGMGYDFIYLKNKYLDSKEMTDTQGNFNTLINLSFGYTLTSLTMGPMSPVSLGL